MNFVKNALARNLAASWLDLRLTSLLGKPREAPASQSPALQTPTSQTPTSQSPVWHPLVTFISYGNFGGPFWTNGRIAELDEAPCPTCPPVDPLDALFCVHDAAYSASVNEEDGPSRRLKADLDLAVALIYGLKYAAPTLSRYAHAYRYAAIVAILSKLSLSPAVYCVSLLATAPILEDEAEGPAVAQIIDRVLL